MLDTINEELQIIITNFGILAPIISSLLIILESLIPLLPLVMFVSINFLLLGPLLGLAISTVCAIVGSVIVFIFFRNKVQKKFNHKIVNAKRTKKLLTKLNNIHLTTLVILIANPFLPSSLINVASGLSKITKKKYIIALIIGKIFLIYFWGTIGTGLLESLQNPKILIELGIITLIAYIISKIVNKKYKID